jgi:hypothetical protein
LQKPKELHVVFEFFYCVRLPFQAETEIVSGRLKEPDMLAATRTLEKLYPTAIEFQVRKYNCKAAALC